jgi:hypothetical protein
MNPLFALLVSSAIMLGAAETKPAVKARRPGEPTPTPAAFSTTPTERCGVSVSLPPGWQAEVTETLHTLPTCTFGLLPPGYAEFSARSEVERDPYPVTVVLSHAGVEQAASSGGFVTREGQWYVTGRAGSETEASRMEGKGWYGISGTPSIGMNFKAGAYAGLGDTRRVLVVGPDSRCAVLDVSVVEYQEAFGRILASFRFLDAPGSK